MNWLFAKRVRSFVLLAAFVSLALNVTLLMPAIYMMQVFDRVFSSRSVETLVMLSAITLLFLALGYFLDTVRARALAWAGRSVDRELSPAALTSALEQAAASSGRVDVDTLRDIAHLRSFLSGLGVLAFFDAPWLSIYLLLIALMHPLLGLAAAIGAAALVALGVLTDRLTREHAEQTLRGSRASVRQAEMFARNAEAIVAMGMTKTVVARWRERHDAALDAQQQYTHTSSGLSAFARILRQVLQVTMLGVGAWLVVGTQASAGIMIAATILLSRALQPVEHLISGWRVLIDARAAWRRLSERRTSDPIGPQIALPTPAGRIDVQRLSYTFAASGPALIKNVDFSIEPGESVGVIGASASGKTTLLRLILGLRRPQLGVVRLDGADVSRWDRNALGEHIGYLPQDVDLFGRTVGENIARLNPGSGKAHSERIVYAARLAHAHEMILQLPEAYDTQLGEGGTVLSGGQRQRIALARALYGDPRVVVLDEPNANLDSAGEAALLASLADLKLRGVTVIMVTHKPALMARLDKLALLRNGALEMFGASATVMAHLQTAAPARILAFPSTRNSESQT
jgi:PrtD family type I secretion system ABC transporter